jgi:hypothetical protein
MADPAFLEHYSPFDEPAAQPEPPPLPQVLLILRSLDDPFHRVHRPLLNTSFVLMKSD